MPKLLERLPKYRRHSSRDLGFVVLNGTRHYLPGRFGSAESRREYRRLCLEWESSGRPDSPLPPAGEITIAELLAAYWRFASRHYVKNGRVTAELYCVKAAVRFVRELYADLPAGEFSPLKLKTVRDRMIAHGLARRTINQHCSRIRRLFRWGVSEELLPVTTWQALGAMQGLQRGRTTARETAPILPVADSVVELTLPHLPAVVRDMVRLQRLCGMRPHEVCQLRPGDVDRAGDVWRFTPLESKMEHRGRGRVIFIGPRGQEILTPYLLRPADEFCFSPRDSEAARRAERHAARVTPPSYGNTIGTNRSRHPARPPRERYDTGSYRRAISRGCELAFGIPRELRNVNRDLPPAARAKLREQAAAWRVKHCWRPNQLRHAAATQIRERFGVEHAQHTLGHTEPATTLIYAERSEKLAGDVARLIG